MLIDKMLFLFEADADSIKKGTQEGKKGADDLTSAMKKADAQSKKTSANFASFAKQAFGFIGAASAAAAAATIAGAVNRAGDIQALDDLSSKVGLGITETDALSRSIIAMGGSFDSANSDIESLADSLKKQGVEPMQGMLKLADELQGMDFGKASEKLGELGVTDRATVELMRKGRQEVERLMGVQKQNGAITQESADKARKFNQSMSSFKSTLGNAANGFLELFIPAITKGLDALGKFVGWMSDNKDFVIGFLIAIAAAMLPVAATTIAATWPLIAIGAAIAAAAAMFALIYDDIMNFIDGNDSLIGQIINDFPIIGDIINAVIDGIKIAFEVAGVVADALLNHFKFMASGIVAVFKWLWDAIKAYIGFITAGVEKVAAVAGKISSWFGDKLGIATEEKVTREVEDVYTGGDYSVSPSSRMSGVDFVDDGGGRSGGNTVHNNDNSRTTHNNDNSRTTNEVINSTQIAQQQIAQVQQQPANAMTSNAINNQRTNNIESNLTIGQVTVETQATDAAGVSAGLSDSLSAELEKMQANNATPITR